MVDRDFDIFVGRPRLNSQTPPSRLSLVIRSSPPPGFGRGDSSSRPALIVSRFRSAETRREISSSKRTRTAVVSSRPRFGRISIQRRGRAPVDNRILCVYHPLFAPLRMRKKKSLHLYYTRTDVHDNVPGACTTTTTIHTHVTYVLSLCRPSRSDNNAYARSPVTAARRVYDARYPSRFIVPTYKFV